ncbi:unnamed protein product (mitochondrion) [Plasmodiophora brassicae]|uniref:Uncharacterized protein n=1 Tax=Plasmodiophora brassicae TaxID=37360 RepID=A0A3P3Y871_PLABS|nr:unnamed protein product [Plasmodiophora brassicae]
MQYARQGAEQLRQDDFPGAVISFTKALFLLPNNAALHTGRGCAFIGLGDIKSAIVNLRRAQALGDGDPSIPSRLSRLYSKLGHVHADIGDHPQASICYLQALDIDRTDVTFWMDWITSLVHERRYDETVEALAEFMALPTIGPDCQEPPYVDLILTRALALLKLRRYADAHDDLQRGLAMNADHERLPALRMEFNTVANELHGEAELLGLSDRLSSAIEHATWALRLSDGMNKIDHFRLRARLLQKRGEYTSALDDLEDALALCGADHSTRNPIFSEISLVENQIGVELFSRRSVQHAISHLNRAILLDPLQTAFYVNRGDCFMALGQLNYAMADFHEADRLEALRSRDSPCRSGIRGRLATIHYRFGVQAFNRRSLGEAAVEFTDAIALAPSTAQYYVNRGIVLERMQDPVNALADFTQAIKLDPGNADAAAHIATLNGGHRHEFEIVAVPASVRDKHPKSRLHVIAQNRRRRRRPQAT